MNIKTLLASSHFDFALLISSAESSSQPSSKIKMPGNNNDDLERGGREAQRDTESTHPPLGLFKGSVESLTRCLSRSSKGSQTDFGTAGSKKYVHTPTHAAASHLKTTRTRNMDRANEVL